MAQREDSVSGGRSGSREIRSELDRTRASLDRAFDALGSKLTPASLFWDGVGVFRSGAGAGVSRAMQMAQQHPLPACVIGMGVGWLLLENARSRRGDGTYQGTPAEQAEGSYAGRAGTYPGTPAELNDLGGAFAGSPGAAYGAGYGYGANRESAAGVTTRVRETASDAVEKVGEVASRAGERVSESAEVVKEKASRAAETVKDQASRTAQTVRQQASQAAGAVREQASHTADAVREKAERVGQQARDKAQRARSEFERLLNEQPMAVGLGALALGLLAGLLIPSTRREDEVLGVARDRKLERAREAARETLQKGKRVARTAVETVKETVRTEAERQHLRPRDIVDQVVGGQQAQDPGQPPYAR